MCHLSLTDIEDIVLFLNRQRIRYSKLCNWFLIQWKSLTHYKYICQSVQPICLHLLIVCECLFIFTLLQVNACLHLLITCECLFTFTHYLWMFVYIYSLLVNVHYIYSLCLLTHYLWMLFTFTHYLWMFVHIYSLLVNVCSHLLITSECLFTFTHYL